MLITLFQNIIYNFEALLRLLYNYLYPNTIKKILISKISSYFSPMKRFSYIKLSSFLSPKNNITNLEKIYLYNLLGKLSLFFILEEILKTFKNISNR